MRTLIFGLATLFFATVFGEGYITSVQLPRGETKQIRDEETANSLTNYATRAELEAGWWSEWEVSPNDGTTVRWSDTFWFFIINGDEWPATGGDTENEDATYLEYDGVFGNYTATRHRVSAPVPTKPEDIGAQAALTFDTTPTANSANPVTSGGIKTALDGKASVADATLTPVYSQTPTFSEWMYSQYPDGWSFFRSPEYYGDGVWELSITDQMGEADATFAGDEYATVLTFDYRETMVGNVPNAVITASRRRTDIIGYTLGSQTNIPLQIAGNYQAALTPQQLENIDNVTNKYTKPSSGIPKSDLSSGVQASLDLADSALQKHQSLTNYYTIAETDYAINLLAAYYITMNAEGDAFPTYESLTNTATYYSGGEPRTPTRNDYAVVLADETHNTNEWRYIYTVSVVDGVTNSQWDAQYPIETNDYEALANKPSIGGVELTGDKTAAELGLATDTYVNNLDTSYHRFVGLTNINQSIQYFTTTEGDGITNLVIQLPDDGETKDWVVYVNAAAELTLTLPEATWWMANPSYVNNIASNTPTALYFTQVTTGIYLLGRQELYAVPIPTPVVEEEPEPEPEQSEEPEEQTP